jgi:hypothetical protein
MSDLPSAESYWQGAPKGSRPDPNGLDSNGLDSRGQAATGYGPAEHAGIDQGEIDHARVDHAAVADAGLTLGLADDHQIPARGAFSAADALAAATTRRLRELSYWRLGAAFGAGAVILGLVQGWIWSMIAPTEQFKVFTDGGYGALSTVSIHQFAGIAIFMLMACAVGVAIAVAGWSFRSLRNPMMVIIVGASSALGGFAAYLLAGVLASGTQPWTIGPSNIERIVQAPPTAGNAMTLLVEPTAALVVYALCALVDWLFEKEPVKEHHALPVASAGPPEESLDFPRPAPSSSV